MKNKVMQKALSWTLSVAMAATMSGAVPAMSVYAADSTTAKDVYYSQLAGDGRYDTAASIAEQWFKAGNTSTTAVLVYGGNFPDALSASGLAGVLKAPLLMTDTASLSTQTQKVITDHKITNIYIVGGEGVVSKAVADALEKAGCKTTRVSGDDRQQTAEQVEAKILEKGGSTDTVFVATGNSAADAISASAWAYKMGAPMLLADADGNLTSASLAIAKAAKQVYVLGGEGAVSKATYDSLTNSKKRLAGEGRYDTSKAIATEFAATGVEGTGFASGSDDHYSDALAGGCLMGSKGAPILLVDGTTGAGFDYAKSVLANKTATIAFLGGTGAVPTTTSGAITSLWGGKATKTEDYESTGTATDKMTKLEATGSKELTATLSKEVNVEAKDIVVKKGNVTLTPADVVTTGTTVKITLASKITKDTYSVEYNKSTVSVETEDEKLVELKTVGTALAQAKDADITPNGTTAIDSDNTTINAKIEYQALNQYGEMTNADILSVTSTFGGAANFTEPTAKRNGTIYLYNISAALGIAGTKGKIIIVSKNGVTTTNEVTMSEEAKVAKITLDGIYNTATGKMVESVPAQKDASNFVLVINPVDQYDRPINDQKMLYQTVSVAQVLTNMNVAGISANKLTADSFDKIEIEGKDRLVLKLTGTKVTAGSLQIIIVGDRFGSVFNETIKVEQIDLIKSFTFSNQGTVYNKYPNVMDYTATSVAGTDIKDYSTLTKLVAFNTPELKWEKQTDGTAKLIYTPNQAEGAGAALDTTNENQKQSTVLSTTATANAAISAGDQIVVPKTFTVYEKRVPKSLVKYTGEIVSQAATLTLTKSKFVVEDQYGNTMDAGDGTMLTGVSIDKKLGTDGAVNTTSEATWTESVTSTAQKLYLSVAGQSNTSGAFDYNKAQLALSIQQVNAKKATNLTATWSKSMNAGDARDIDGTLAGGSYQFITPAAYQKVLGEAASSGIAAADFTITGTVNGKKITIPADNYTIKTDSYVPITFAEEETAVKDAKVTFTVTLTDDENKEYTEEVTADYKYSAAPSKIVGFKSYSDISKAANVAYEAENTSGKVTPVTDLAKWFVAYDQYGAEVPNNATYSAGTTTVANPNNGATPSFEISLGDGTTGWALNKNNTKSANMDYCVTAGKFTVVATLENGLTAKQDVVTTANTTAKGALTIAINTDLGTANTAFSALDGTAEKWTAWTTARDTAEKQLALYKNLFDTDITNDVANNYTAYTTNKDKVTDANLAKTKQAINALDMASHAAYAKKDALKSAIKGVAGWTDIGQSAVTVGTTTTTAVKVKVTFKDGTTETINVTVTANAGLTADNANVLG